MGKRNLIIFFAVIYVVTVMAFFKGITGDAISRDRLTAICLESSLPPMEFLADPASEKKQSDETVQAASAKAETTGDQDRGKTKTKKTGAAPGKPKVLIYHTHATESYLPATAGNYHTVKEENTVRDAGNVLAKTLEKNGIGVVHDKTLHDNPSYNESYSRSFETVKRLLEKYPSVECIIDLHRDAIPGKPAGPTQNAGGKPAAVYSYVLSNTTETYRANREFLHKLNQIADSRYEGYTGNILERPYWYNQELSKKAVLIEMGNNRNNIKDVRRCAEIFGEILAQALLE